MGFVFKKLNTGEVVSSVGGMVFRKLSTEGTSSTPPILELTPEHFDLRILVAFGLGQGTHTITVTSLAPSLQLAESGHSDSVEYKVE